MGNRTILLGAFLAFAAISCGTSDGCGNEETLTVEQILSEMRNDAEWVAELDSMAAVGIGPGAVCLDAVKHTFLWNGRLWVYNQDWGGVLEIPEGYVPVDDEIQTELSYHGAAIFSPDSTVLISHYEGFQYISFAEFRQCCTESFEADNLLVEIKVREDKVVFGDGSESPVLVYETLNSRGIKGYFRFIYSGPQAVEYSVSVQYPAERERDCFAVRMMVDRYPFGPFGQDPEMEN